MATHAKDVIADFDSRVSDRLSALGASMGFFWFCVALDLVALPGLVIQIAQVFGAHFPSWVSGLSVLVIIAAFLSQTVIQLLMLPVLQNSANKVQAHSEAIAEATFRNAEAAEKMLEELIKRTPEPVK
jgi:Na+-driven multidrug efflux pump